MMYSFFKAIFYFIFQSLCKWKVTGKENMPSKGAVVVMSNHVSMWDPMAIAVPFHRDINYMAKEELFSYPVLGRIIKGLGAFPVRRGQLDRVALKNAMKILREGRVLGIFPEGGRSPTGKLMPFKPGAINLAIKCDAIILPVGLVGTGNIFSKGSFQTFRVNIGTPIDPKEIANIKSKVEQSEELTRKVWEEIARLSNN